MQEKILILDFGSQYTQLIARRIREMNVYCEVHSATNIPKITANVKGIILSGSHLSVRQVDAIIPDLTNIKGKVPLLGLCYGAQLLSHFYGGEVEKSETREYGRAILNFVNSDDDLFKGVKINSQVWMSNGDTITKIPEHYNILASTSDVKIAGYVVKNELTWGIQFHPEVYHTTEGFQILNNFVITACKCTNNWTSDSFIETTVNRLQEQIGDQKVVFGLSGGVDSTVAAVILHKAIGSQLYCIFVDNGLLRKNEFESVLESYIDLGLNVKGVRAQSYFYDALAGISDPELKRKAIGKTFIEVFDREAQLISDVKWLGQGTIYPDVIESVSVQGPSQTIKSHHNVGCLPDYMKLKIVEPIRSLFKDEVRKIGAVLGIKDSILNRHPFPGPGLAIRILGDVTLEKVTLIQEVDEIFINNLKTFGLYNSIWQAGAILLPIQSVGVMGDERTYENVVALRAVSSTDGMTAD